MSKRNLSVVEMHFEKGVLGLGALFAVGLVAYYVVASPNRIDFDGESIGPSEVDQKVLSVAESLQQRVRAAKADPAEIPDYSTQLAAQLDAGLLSAPEGSAPPLPVKLRLAATFGNPIPTAVEKDEGNRDIELVTPERPSQPRARSGLSLAQKKQVTLGEASSSDNKDEPVELSWVTVGAYYPKQSVETAMTAAKYATRFAKVVFAGVEAERQEMLANGDWSEWKPVALSTAMPKFTAVEPAIGNNGDVTNRQALDSAFEKLKANQATLVQAPFYDVKAGDDWKIPPIAGHEDQEEEEADTPKPKPKKEKEDRPRPPPTRAPQGPTGDGGGGGGGRGRAGGGGGGGAPPGRVPPAQPGNDAEAKKQAKEDLAAARKALAAKDYDEAESKANAVVGNAAASTGDQKAAQKIVEDAQAAREKLNESDGGGGGNPRMGGRGGPPMDGGTRGFGRGGPSPQETGPKLITDPDNAEDPAIWFHDDSVEPGKTYRYRIRAVLWNRYAGRIKALKDPSQAAKSVLEGDWSLPSEPITVAASTHFFVRSGKPADNTASVQVFKWLKGKWVNTMFDVKVGDVVGQVREVRVDETSRDTVDFSTGAVILDLRIDENVRVRTPTSKQGEFNISESPAVVITYLDPADGQVKERANQIDSKDPLFKKLRDAKGG